MSFMDNEKPQANFTRKNDISIIHSKLKMKSVLSHIYTFLLCQICLHLS